MENNFNEYLITNAKKLNIIINEEQAELFKVYTDLLIDWNNRINLTAITKPNEIIIKHYIDSLTLLEYVPKNAKIADIGTGAGFPGIPLKIMRTDINVHLMDSLNKRINFLNEVISNLNLKKIYTVHTRAEDAGNNKEFREKFDIVTARAVAKLPILLEYTLPLVSVKGTMIAMKAIKGKEEILLSKKALHVLGGEIKAIKESKLPEENANRQLILVKKVKKTMSKYPRKAGKPNKEPIL